MLQYRRSTFRNLFLLFPLLISSGIALAQETVANVVKGSSDAVVLIVTSDSSGQETALGSGFLISDDGEIVTNYHVIRVAESAVAKVSKGEVFPVSGILASDRDRDLAVIKIDGANLPFLTLANDDKLQLGDHVVAIGSPLGLEGTVSDGVISSFREFGGQNWIQTTVPVSHGNSGGPLLDMRGNVVGVITRISEKGQNLNFAIPSDDLNSFLSAHGVRASRAFGDPSRETQPANAQSSDTSAAPRSERESQSKGDELAGRAITYAVCFLALGMIPTWVALYRKHTYKGWVIVLNIIASLIAFGAASTSPLQIFGSLGWMAVLVYSFSKHGRVDQPIQYPGPPHPPQSYPNGQIVKTGPEGVRAVAPKDALDCREAVLYAVEKRTGSYFA
jgi:hypothetical protein